jgi:beta-galactosidase
MFLRRWQCRIKIVMAHLLNRQFIIQGKPELVLSGEVHYFRLKKGEWEDRIVKTKEAGCNAVASYIPWLWHEERSGDIDVTGRTRPERDLGAFIDLCQNHGLWFIARPGPYVMAEVKNEGLPFWVFDECPDAETVNWNGAKAKSKVVRYNDAEFLSRVRRWYGGVMPILASRLDSVGGNVIAVQLDNEIGMLQCWSEDPDLSEDTLCAFAEYVLRHGLESRYGFEMGDPVERVKLLRNPSQADTLVFHEDYSHFIRGEFSRYVASLRKFAEDFGVRDVPFIVNIHGSGGGRATTFPIGIAQTYEAYTQDDNYWGSSDHYLGDITRDNVGDLYMLNAFMACVNRPNQPLSSVEFEAGTGDYGETGGRRYSGTATDFKARMSVIQGNRLLNHYLISGGRNPMMDDPLVDGNGRIGTTGERHGFAAPIGPEGRLDPVYWAMKDTNETLLANSEILATGREEWDDIPLGFIPDYYSTDLKPEGPMRDLAGKLESARGWQERLVRSMLQRGLSYPAFNLQSGDMPEQGCLALATSICLDPGIGGRLLEFAEMGGRVILFGPVPTLNMVGQPMSILVDRLGVKVKDVMRGSSEYFPSMRGLGFAAGEPEARFYEGFPFECGRAEPFLGAVQREDYLGARIPVGNGSVTLVTVQPPQHRSFWEGFFDLHGVAPGLEHDDLSGGTVLSRFSSENGSLLSLINLDEFEKSILIEGVDQRVRLAPREAKLLPWGMPIRGSRVEFATAEIVRREGRDLWFRQGDGVERVLILGAEPMAGEGGSIRREGERFEVNIEAGKGSVRVRF